MYKFLREHALSLLCITIVAAWGLSPLMHDGLYTAHDIWHQVARLFHYTEALKDGQFFPAWVSTLAHGNGYPLFLFSYHLPWFLGSALVLLGFSIPVSLKLVFGLSFLASGIAFYYLAYALIPKKLPAVLAACLYLVAPFHFLSIYVSASIGTTVLYLILPLFFLGIHNIFEKKWVSGIAITALSAAGAILTHLMSLVIFAPFIALFALFKFIPLIRAKNWKITGSVLLSFVVVGSVSLLLTAFYSVPLLSYLPLTRAQDAGNGFSELFASNLVTIKQLLYSTWGFGPIISNAKDGQISLQLGIAQWLAVIGLLKVVLIGRFFSQFFDKKLVKAQKYTMFVILATFVTTIIAMTDVGHDFWQFMTSVVSIDYPFRLLTLSVFLASLAAHFFVSALKPRQLQWFAATVLLIVALYTNRNHVRVNLYTYISVVDYVQAETTTNSFHEYLPKTADFNLMNIEKQRVVVENLPDAYVTTTTNQLAFSLKVGKEQSVTIRQFDFPGQTLFIDGVKTAHAVDQSGRIKTTLPAGEHQVAVKYIPTGLMKISTLISVISFCILCVGWYILEKRRKSYEKT